MERGQRRTPSQPHAGQPQRPAQRPTQNSPQRQPQRRPAQSTRPAQPTRPVNRKRKKNKSKKSWIIGAIVVLLLIIVFGSGGNESTDQIKQNADSVTAFNQQVASATPNISIPTQAPTQTPTQVPTPRPTAAPSRFPQTIFDMNGVKISVTGFDKSEWLGPEIKLTVENNSGMNLYLVTGELYCDGWQLKDFTCLFEIANGAKAADTITIYKDDLENCGLTVSDLKNVTFKNARLQNNDDYTQSYTFEMSATLQ